MERKKKKKKREESHNPIPLFLSFGLSSVRIPFSLSFLTPGVPCTGGVCHVKPRVTIFTAGPWTAGVCGAGKKKKASDKTHQQIIE